MHRNCLIDGRLLCSSAFRHTKDHAVTSKYLLTQQSSHGIYPQVRALDHHFQLNWRLVSVLWLQDPHRASGTNRFPTMARLHLSPAEQSGRFFEMSSQTMVQTRPEIPTPNMPFKRLSMVRQIFHCSFIDADKSTRRLPNPVQPQYQ